MNCIRLFISCVLLFFVADKTIAQTDGEINSIRQHAIFVNTNLADTGNLFALKQILNNRIIVGVGEATHGTHEFFTMKHKILKFLVQDMGFRVFAIEGNFTECRAINDYVLYGRGNAKRAIWGMGIWPWNTQEVLQMVEWMKTFNAGKAYADQVKFYGFDMQFDRLPIESVISKLKQLDSMYYEANFHSLDKLHIYAHGTYTKYTKKQTDSIKILLADISGYLLRKEEVLLKKYPKRDIDYLNQDVNLISQCLEYDEAASNNRLSANVRDKYMAQNVAWILQEENGSKIMLWAHNDHINKFANSMGACLKTDYKNQYYAIGFNFANGGFRAIDSRDKQLKNFSINQIDQKSIGNVFSQLNMTAFFIDVEGIEKIGAEACRIFDSRIPYIDIGAVYNPTHPDWFYSKEPLHHLFDGLIFVKETSAAAPML